MPTTSISNGRIAIDGIGRTKSTRKRTDRYSQTLLPIRMPAGTAMSDGDTEPDRPALEGVDDRRPERPSAHLVDQRLADLGRRGHQPRVDHPAAHQQLEERDEHERADDRRHPLRSPGRVSRRRIRTCNGRVSRHLASPPSIPSICVRVCRSRDIRYEIGNVSYTMPPASRQGAVGHVSPQPPVHRRLIPVLVQVRRGES